MSQLAPTITQLAEEAEFQLICAREQLSWFGAIARAIALDDEHGGGCNVRDLAKLAIFLDDTVPSGIEQAIDSFKQVAASQNANNENVARTSAEVSQ